MSKSVKNAGLTRIANGYVDRLEQAQKLKEVANRKNYPHKVKILHERILEEYGFWKQKQNPQEKKLADLKKDLIFIHSQLDELDLNKERIDLLMSKYGYN